MQSSQENYSEQSFWKKIRKFAGKAGEEVIENALILFYAAQQPGVPAWAKTIIYGALAYFIYPLDAIPDITPGVGYADDLAALLVALGVATCNTNPSNLHFPAFLNQDYLQLKQPSNQD